MTARGFPLGPPVDTVGDGTEFAGCVQVTDAFGRTEWVTRGGFPTMVAARAWAARQQAPVGLSIGYTGAYRVLRAEHR